MEKKVNKRAKPEKKQPLKDDVVLELGAPIKAAKKAAKPAAAKKVSAKKTVAGKSVAKVVDPFAEIATDKPVRKRTVKPRAKTKTVSSPTSPVVEKPGKTTKASTRRKPAALDVTAELAATDPEVQLSPAFKALADVTLPELPRENRARLLMQSPTRLYFYWSLRDNPWQQLRSAFGDAGSYTLVMKLTNSRTGSEDLYPAEAAGEWWFTVEPDGEYRAEIGFYAPNRPYFRIVTSNEVETPRRSPSPHPASDARWTVSATKFAEVLDVSGFSRDAFDVAMTGDDASAAAEATRAAFSRLTGSEHGIENIPAEDVRHALISLAAGTSLDELKHQISDKLFATLQTRGSRLTADAARVALTEHFDIGDEEWTEYETGSAVFGASLVSFPKTLRTRNRSSRYNPLSSHSVLS